MARGDRYFGVVKLLHNLASAARSSNADIRPTPGTLERVEQVLDEVLEASTFRRYWAHETLNMLYASLRWGTSESFAICLELGESKLT